MPAENHAQSNVCNKPAEERKPCMTAGIKAYEQQFQGIGGWSGIQHHPGMR